MGVTPAKLTISGMDQGWTDEVHLKIARSEQDGKVLQARLLAASVPYEALKAGVYVGCQTTMRMPKALVLFIGSFVGLAKEDPNYALKTQALRAWMAVCYIVEATAAAMSLAIAVTVKPTVVRPIHEALGLDGQDENAASVPSQQAQGSVSNENSASDVKPLTTRERFKNVVATVQHKARHLFERTVDYGKLVVHNKDPKLTAKVVGAFALAAMAITWYFASGKQPPANSDQDGNQNEEHVTNNKVKVNKQEGGQQNKEAGQSNRNEESPLNEQENEQLNKELITPNSEPVGESQPSSTLFSNFNLKCPVKGDLDLNVTDWTGTLWETSHKTSDPTNNVLRNNEDFGKVSVTDWTGTLWSAAKVGGYTVGVGVLVVASYAMGITNMAKNTFNKYFGNQKDKKVNNNIV